MLEQFNFNSIITAIFTLVIFIITLIVFFYFLKRILRIVFGQPGVQSQKILQVAIPKVSLAKENEEEDILEEIGKAENLFSVLGGLKAQRSLKNKLLGRTDHFSFEIVSTNDQILFYIAAPHFFEDTLKQQLLAAYPFANIEELGDYNFFKPQGKIVGSYLKFGREYILPIKTFRKMESDPLDGLLNTLAKLPNEAGAAVQIILRSSHKKWHRRGQAVAREMQQGKSLSEASRKAGLGNIFDKLTIFFTFIFSFFKNDKKVDQSKELDEEKHKLSPMEEETIKGIEEKTSKAGFDVNIRVVVSAVESNTAYNHLQNILNSFAQYNIYQYGNGFKKAKMFNKKKVISDFIKRSFSRKYNLVLNAEELTSIWHLPLVSSSVPKIKWLESRKAQPPNNLPAEGILLGDNEYRGIKTEVRIKSSDRLRHTYIIGKSGVGKSVMQANLINQDIKNGEGVCVIDPHGDLIDSVLEHIPENRFDDVILFDPADHERPLGLNMLEYQSEDQKTFVINEMITIFDKLYDLKATGGPMFEQYMRNAMLLMMEDPESGATLLEVPKVLTDASFRRYKLANCGNSVVKDFWEKEAQKAGGDASLANMTPYITSKLTPFLASDLMRPIIAQQKSSFNFREVMDKKQILLVKLSKGKIGELSSNLLGMVIVGKILMAALSRVDLAEDSRTPFYLYIDEFQNFITESIGIILSEARKYKLSLTFAHQFVAQLVKDNDTTIRDAVFGNIGTF